MASTEVFSTSISATSWTRLLPAWPATRLRPLADKVPGRVEVRPDTLAARCLDQQIAEDARRVDRLEQLVAGGPASRPWRHDADAAIQLLHQSLRAPCLRTPADLTGLDPNSPDTGLVAGQILAAWAHLCLAWTTVRERAAQVPSAFEVP